MSNMTHTFCFGDKHKNTTMHNKNIGVYNSGHGCDGESMWLDKDGNTAGWAKKDGTPNIFGSYVKKKK